MTDDHDNQSEETEPASDSLSQESQKNEESVAESKPEDETESNQSAGGASGDPDELPEEEELTPELVEEEAIRGDFMLRWAAILLAALFGFTQISDTRTLVHVRSGDQMRANGFLPERTDSLSFANEGQSVANVSWLFDHIVSFAWQMGEETGLMALKVVVAITIGYLLSIISVSGVPTWWSSICGVIAIAACSSDLVPITDLATVLCLTILLRWLHQHFEGEADGLKWKIPVLMIVWANLDSRAFLGVLAIAAYSLGSGLAKSRNPESARNGSLWPVAGLALAALLINPFPVASLLSVVTVYGVEYPLEQLLNGLSASGTALLDGRTEAFSMLNPDVYPGFEFAYVAGVTLLIFALVVIGLSRKADELPWVMIFAVFALLAIFRLHELPAASLVAAVVAGTVAQRWYRRTFPQEYSTATTEVMFSRGGRAATVFAFALLGFLVVADRLPTRNPVGIGFEADLKTTMTSLGEQLDKLPEDAHILHTKPEQGDVLIWHGRQSLIDSRTTVFGRAGSDTSVIDQHRLLITQIMRPNVLSQMGSEDESDAPDTDWRPKFEEWEITHVMPRMAPPGPPDYESFFNLYSSGEWVLSDIGASAAIFQHVDRSTTIEELRTKTLDVGQRAFRDVEPLDPEAVERIEFAREPDFYREHIYRERSVKSKALREAELYAALVPAGVRSVAEAEYALALPMLTVRRAAQAVAEDPYSFEGYLLLGKGYSQLSALESTVAQAHGGSSPETVRYYQAIIAFHQATILEPNDSRAWGELFSLFYGRGRTELASICVDRFLEIEDNDLNLDPQMTELIAQRREIQSSLNDYLQQVRQNQTSRMESATFSEDPQQHAMQKLQIVQELSNAGLVQTALDLCEENADLLITIPQFDFVRGNLMLEAGELEEGYQLVKRATVVAQEQPALFQLVQWHAPAAIACLAKAEYPEAVEIWNEQAGLFHQVDKDPAMINTLLTSLPLVSEVESGIGLPFPAWPFAQCGAMQRPMKAIPMARTEPLFMTAMVQLESGMVDNARLTLQKIVEDEGEVQYRPLSIVYLNYLRDNAQEIVADTVLNQWEEWPVDVSDAESVDEAETGTGQESEPTDSEQQEDVK